jgi:2-amino-4-hydroxy-6-hydroxymethyldihydropteridine diphosphokinase/putative membrane protein
VSTSHSRRLVRIAFVSLFTAGLGAAGCSLLTDFDESRIPAPSDGAVDALPETPPVDAPADIPGEPDADANDDAPVDDADATNGDADAANGDADATNGDADAANGDADAANGDADAANGDADAANGDADAANGDAEPINGDADAANGDAEPINGDADASNGDADAANGDANGDAETGPAAVFFRSTLGADQVMGAGSTSDRSGAVTCALDGAKSSLSCTVTHDVGGATEITLGHAPGGIESIATLFTFPSAASPAAAVWTLGSADVALLERGAIHVSIATPTYPAGDIRGQLLRPGESLYIVRMSGAKEATPVSPAGNGSGSFVLSADRTSLRYDLVARDMTSKVTMAHIHEGAVGVNGPVVHNLAITSAAEAAPFVATLAGLIEGLPGSDATKLDAELFYVNVHTSTNPTGEIRDQLRLTFTAP